MYYVDTGGGGGDDGGGGFLAKTGSVVKKILFYNTLLWCLVMCY